MAKRKLDVLLLQVRDRRVPGPAVPVRRRGPREGGRAGGLRHGARDVVPGARRNAEVMVGGGDGEAAGRGPAGRARGEAAGGRVGWRVAGPQGHLQGVPACRHRQGRRPCLIERVTVWEVYMESNAHVKNGVLYSYMYCLFCLDGEYYVKGYSSLVFLRRPKDHKRNFGKKKRR